MFRLDVRAIRALDFCWELAFRSGVWRLKRVHLLRVRNVNGFVRSVQEGLNNRFNLKFCNSCASIWHSRMIAVLLNPHCNSKLAF